jgi:hypothetical protein
MSLNKKDISNYRQIKLNNDIEIEDFEDSYNLFILNMNKTKEVDRVELNNNKYLDIDYYKIIKNNIKNLIILDDYQLEYIKKLSHEDKNEIFDIFNNAINSINTLLNY